jgi:hypothetical protein
MRRQYSRDWVQIKGNVRCRVCRVLPARYSPTAAVPDSAGWSMSRQPPTILATRVQPLSTGQPVGCLGAGSAHGCSAAALGNDINSKANADIKGWWRGCCGTRVAAIGGVRGPDWYTVWSRTPGVTVPTSARRQCPRVREARVCHGDARRCQWYWLRSRSMLVHF